MDVMAHAERERAELAALLTDLTPQEWQAPTLCDGWTVRDVAAHVLSYEGVPMTRIVGRMLRSRMSLAGTNARTLASVDDESPADLLAKIARYPRPTGLTAARGGGVGLVDAMIHQQDVRRPLGRPRDLDPERLRYALGFTVTAPPLRGFWQVRGTRVVADDVDWAHGRGPEARGPGEAVLMALAGRRGAADDLTGPGADVLRERLG